MRYGKSFSTFHVSRYFPFDENELYTASLQSSSFGIFPPSQPYPQASASHLHAPNRHLLRIAEVPLQRSRCGHAAYVACSTSTSPPHLHGPALARMALTHRQPACSWTCFCHVQRCRAMCLPQSSPPAFLLRACDPAVTSQSNPLQASTLRYRDRHFSYTLAVSCAPRICKSPLSCLSVSFLRTTSVGG